MICSSCKGPKASLSCGRCAVAICKRCAQTVEPGTFAFLEQIPADISHKTYCVPCYNEAVQPALSSYNGVMARARKVYIFEKKTRGAETRLIKRTEKPVKVEGCSDERDTLMRLAFRVASRGFNALIDVDVQSKKVRDEDGYQTTTWQGIGVPVRVDAVKLEKNQDFATLRTV